MRHEYLAALHASGSAVPDSGWAPRFVVLARDGALAAACPAYLKHHSWGEYVFDWAWADAYRRHGLAYYPKLLVAVPFTPVAGTRLLATDEAARTALLGALRALADDAALSSVHLLFADETDRRACAAQGWLLREGVQFHWTQDAGAPAADFDALLARMARDKRKKIQQERRKVAEAGIEFQALEGRAIGEASIEFRGVSFTYPGADRSEADYAWAGALTSLGAALSWAWLGVSPTIPLVATLFLPFWLRALYRDRQLSHRCSDTRIKVTPGGVCFEQQGQRDECNWKAVQSLRFVTDPQLGCRKAVVSWDQGEFEFFTETPTEFFGLLDLAGLEGHARLCERIVEMAGLRGGQGWDEFVR